MAERQETSVMASIQDILRDAQSREEEERVEAENRARADEQRRIDDARRKQEEEAARLKAEEDDRERRIYEEKRRAAELAAMQGAAVERAKAETEAKARLAEMTARQDHERQLHALSQDKGKKNLRMILIGLAVLFISSEIEEVVRNCGRAVVLRERRPAGEAAGADLNGRHLMRLMAGTGEGGQP